MTKDAGNCGSGMECLTFLTLELHGTEMLIKIPQCVDKAEYFQYCENTACSFKTIQFTY